MSNVHGLFSNRGNKNDKDDDDDDDDESNNRYVGGIGARGGGSGLAVLPNPNELRSASAQRDMVFGLAQEAGTNDDDNEQDQQQQIRRTITMYQNGFIVDDGPYRRLDDPANAEFLRSLAIGRTPRELMEPVTNEDGTKNNNITVGLIDKRSEDYIEPFRSFSGAGETLGSTTTAAAGSMDGVFDPTTMPSSSSSSATTDNDEMTSIAIRLPNGKRKIIKISVNATISDLAVQLRDDSENNAPFRLMTGFPPQPITDTTSTIVSAGLKGAQISMHKVG